MRLINSLVFLGRWCLNQLEEIGKLVIFTGSLIFGFGIHTRLKNFLEQLVRVGTNGLPVITFMSVFVGGVMVVQSEYTLQKFGAEGFTGSAVALAVIRELSPVLTSLLVIGRSGSAVTAEIGVMSITEQLDALKSLKVNPVTYLFAPRFYAFVISMPILTAYSMVIAILSGYLIGVGFLGLSKGLFISQMQSNVEYSDIVSGILKGFVFGFISGTISVFKGLHTKQGASGVNLATTQSVVYSSIAVLVTDFILTGLFLRYLF